MRLPKLKQLTIVLVGPEVRYVYKCRLSGVATFSLRMRFYIFIIGINEPLAQSSFAHLVFRYFILAFSHLFKNNLIAFLFHAVH
jgi:hypothetical protein